MLNEEHMKDDSISLGVDQCHTQAAVIRRQQDDQIDALDSIAEEIPVAMVYNGISHVVMMASPNNLDDFAIGFSLSEGIVKTPEEIYEIDLVGNPEHPDAGIEIRMAITTQRSMLLKQRRRNLTGRTGCGLCGAESLQQAIRPVKAVASQALLTTTAVETAVNKLTDEQPLQSMTGAFHGAAWCALDGKIQLLREDIGRHNALDKLLGALLRKQTDLSQGFVLVSSRASYEMVHKSTSCGVSTLVAVSAPTKLALTLAQRAGMNLIGFARPGRHVIYNQAPTAIDADGL